MAEWIDYCWEQDMAAKEIEQFQLPVAEPVLITRVDPRTAYGGCLS
ncbi:hypothetical protein [Endozoicomonas sp.]|nr:hypothetical protein [Endozoicomonas sp.]